MDGLTLSAIIERKCQDKTSLKEKQLIYSLQYRIVIKLIYFVCFYSPNTPGLRTLQKESELRKLIQAVIETRNHTSGNHKPPIFLKISPDLSIDEKKDIAGVICEPQVRITLV